MLFLQDACVWIIFYSVFAVLFLVLFQLKKDREHAQLVIDHEQLRTQHRNWVLAYNDLLQQY